MVTNANKRQLFSWLVMMITDDKNVEVKHIDNNTFRITYKKTTYDLPYDYWTEWTLGEMIDYVREVIL